MCCLWGLCVAFNWLLFVLWRFWIDTADKQPCIGTGGMIPWHLKATGKLFHSGLAHKVFDSNLSGCFSSVMCSILLWPLLNWSSPRSCSAIFENTLVAVVQFYLLHISISDVNLHYYNLTEMKILNLGLKIEVPLCHPLFIFIVWIQIRLHPFHPYLRTFFGRIPSTFSFSLGSCKISIISFII